MKSYQSHVKAQSRRNPCLATLCRFLDDPNSNRNPCRIAALEFESGKVEPLYRSLDLDGVYSAISRDNIDVSPDKEASDVQGRILIIEDLSRDLVELLGSSLDIDPLFFATHLHARYTDINAQTPDLATLPSRMRRQKFINIQYHRTIVLRKGSDLDRKQVRNMNVSRKVVILPPTRDRYIGLVQHGCSVLKDTRKGKEWLCIVLVDPPIGDDHLSVQGKGLEGMPSSLATNLFLGGYEDFLDPPSILEESKSVPSRRGLLEDLVYYWRRERPESFNREGPTLLSISYYPLKIIAAEWMNYVAVMHYNIKRYEYTIEALPALFQELGKLNTDLQTLQAWRRRCLASQHKISRVKQFVTFHQTGEPKSEDASSLVDDYEHIAESIDQYGRRLENMLPVVTSLVQIVDSRRSFAETANVSRLTYLALVFGPLSFTSSLFSMNTDNAPGGRDFWIYFVVAIPVTMAVFLLARPPWRVLRAFYGSLRMPRKSQFPV